MTTHLPDLKEYLCFNFYVGWRSIQAYYKDWLEDSVTTQRMYVLRLCDRTRPTTVTQIAKALTIDLPAVSGLLERMDKDGLIQRKRVPQNRRTVHVTLTEAGSRVRREQESRLDTAMRNLFDSYVSEDDFAAMQRVVTGIAHALDTDGQQQSVESDTPRSPSKPRSIEHAQSSD